MALDVTNIFIILYSVICLETLMMVFLLWKTPAIPFLGAFLTKNPLIYLMGKDKLGEFRLLKRKHGSAVVRKVGIFNMTENSHTLEAKTKTPLYFAFRDFASTLQLDYPSILQELKERGYKLTNIDDVTNLIKSMKGSDMVVDVNIKPFKTYKLHDLDNMFPYNLDPTFIDAQVQGELNKFSKLTRATPTIIGGLVVLILVVGLAVYIMQKSFKGCISPKECEGMVSAAKCILPQAQMFINNTPLI